MFRRFFIVFFILIFIIPQCFARDYQINYQEKLDYVNMDFWRRFDDDYLCCYIVQAVKNNHDARKASYRVEE